MVTATAAEGEEPMQTDSQAGDAEQPSAASVLQVHVEAGEAAAAQVRAYTYTHAKRRQREVTAIPYIPLSDGDLGPRWAAPGADVVGRGRRGCGARHHHPDGDRPDLRPAGRRHVGRRGRSAGDDPGGAAGCRARR